VRDDRHEIQLDVLITVKAYPQPSKTYGECVCVAGIRLDTVPAEWIRLYPVDFRGLPRRHQFHKYDVVRLRARRRAKGPRPESYTPILDSIRVVEHLRPEDGWSARRPYVEPLRVGSMCELQRLEREQGTSLGVFRPAQIVDLRVRRVDDAWDDGRQAVLDQQSLLAARPMRALQKIPYEFRFEYFCADASCTGHMQMLIDWELGENYRKTAAPGRSEEERVQLVREKWLHTVCGTRRDVHFFAGNQQAHPQSFLILGAFWPPKRKVAVATPALFE
jgi:hypothetical protein